MSADDRLNGSRSVPSGWYGGAELAFLKLGGSLITDKTQEGVARHDVIDRVASEIAEARRKRPDLLLVLGHGSGSFGHPVAARYGVDEGHLADWRGYAETAAAAQRLNRLVLEALLAHGVPAVSVQPSASARSIRGRLVALDSETVRALLGQGPVPLLYGDVALDEAQGCAIISTEEIFRLLAPRLQPSRVIEVGEVEGVYMGDPGTVVDVIHSRSAADLLAGLGSARGVDVTGGMRSKVELLLEMARLVPGLEGRIISGMQPGLVTRVLVDPAVPAGTRVVWALDSLGRHRFHRERE
ncbi:MAG: isopentenyl phosphate kinase [Anaerolineae bacterium]